MLKQIQQFCHYLLGKTSEIGDLDAKDVLLAKTVLDIHRLRSHSRFILVPLFALRQIHAIDRENAIASTEQRIEALQRVREQLLARRAITRALLAEYLPSVSWIKVVREAEDSLIAYEGNGRLVALQRVFAPEDNIEVEVEEYCFTNPKKILRRMNRVRRKNGLLP